MALSMSNACLPAFEQGLRALSGLLDKAEAFAAARKIAPAVLLDARLSLDMLPLLAQIRIACDFAKGTAARLAGQEVPVFADDETSFPALKARIERTLAFLHTVPASAIDGSEGRSIALKIAGQSVTFEGQAYLIGFALPNFYFHLTTAYAILRHVGVEIGKRDFLGGF